MSLCQLEYVHFGTSGGLAGSHAHRFEERGGEGTNQTLGASHNKYFVLGLAEIQPCYFSWSEPPAPRSNPQFLDNLRQSV